ncbi:ATP cone domain-containing protein [uncultured Chitinophaga sp.]|uniref:ATP cone domain-containing protein n=1 Tax=uncultured Chitinophaga sp. TaxID=339340 RepID=UPI0025F88304|nr:ATP cone domain-containing protein [uncultured Chitinophaga sp.]
MKKRFQVTKSDGKSTPFDEDKLTASLTRVGASPEIAGNILAELRHHVYEGIPTGKLYSIAYKMLRYYSRPTAARYKLKQALFELGPSGFPFEKYVAELFKREGYHTLVNQVLEGNCVKHEIDIAGERNGEQLFVECKYHSRQGNFCDVKVPLYIKARYDDLVAHLKMPGQGKLFNGSVCLVTNTRFSEDALQYGLCAGITLISWDFPQGMGLKDRVDAGGLYPVTCLSSLSKPARIWLLDKGVVLCETLLQHPEYLEFPGMTPGRIALVMEELQALCVKAGEKELV